MKMMTSHLLAAFLPLLVFYLVDEYLGTKAGVIAALAFSAAELVFEWYKHRKLDSLTLFMAALVALFGGIALVTGDGLAFMLQPAITEAVLAILLGASALLGKPLLVQMAQKQWQREIPREARQRMSTLTIRCAVFFGIHALITAYAAISLSKAVWIILKGPGFYTSLGLWLLAEFAWAKRLQSTTAAERPLAGKEKTVR